jgi:predicted nuclease of predicted toxin-antitoxin system
MTRLLVDMNLSTEWIPLLRAAGHEAVHWSEVGDPRAPDTALMQWAMANGFAWCPEARRSPRRRAGC